MKIPDGITAIGKNAFSGCKNIEGITIPDSVTSIGENAFGGCTGITSLIIPDSVTSIGDEAFRDCSGLETLGVYGNSTVIGEEVFKGCSALTDVTMQGSIKSVGKDAFYGCSVLKKVNINDIGDWCRTEFENGGNPLRHAKSLYLDGTLVTDIVIPDGVTRIGAHVFSYYDKMTSVTIPDSLTSVGEYAFNGCKGLTDVYVNDIRVWCGIEFGTSSNPLLYASRINGNILTELTIPEGVTKIGSHAFEKCKNLTKVIIPDSVTSIGESAFQGCSSLTGIRIPDSVTELKYNVFCDCQALTYVIIPKSVTSIEGWAFDYCKKIETVFYSGSMEEWEKITMNYGNTPLTKADIVYNAGRRTYKFETNCGVKMSDITDYGVTEAPVITNNGKTLIGWYDNEALLGESVTFPYFGEATTLYAAWKDRMSIDYITVKDAQGNAVNQIPGDSFIVELCVTNDSFEEAPLNLIAFYTSDGRLKRLENGISEISCGQTASTVLEIDNSDGDVSKIKAFIWNPCTLMSICDEEVFPVQ